MSFEVCNKKVYFCKNAWNSKVDTGVVVQIDPKILLLLYSLKSDHEKLATCTYGGVIYENLDLFLDGCNACTCTNGSVFCTGDFSLLCQSRKILEYNFFQLDDYCSVFK